MRKKRRRKKVFLLIILIIVAVSVGIYNLKGNKDNKTTIKKTENNIVKKTYNIGDELDSYKNVKVYCNGTDYSKSYGKNYSQDGYYYGQKWQCVEFVKRFYYEAENHKMPDVYGNAKDFFDPSVKQGELNKRRGLIQYRNGGDVRPQPDDLIVFNDTSFGHVGIVTQVGKDYIEIIQQNVDGKTRQRYELVTKNNLYFVGTKRKPAGWLRKN